MSTGTSIRAKEVSRSQSSSGSSTGTRRLGNTAEPSGGLTTIGSSILERVLQGRSAFFTKEDLKGSALSDNYALQRDPALLYIPSNQFQVFTVLVDGTKCGIRVLIRDLAADNYMYPDTTSEESKMPGFCGLAL